jgi:hypothetical protein
MDSLTIDDPVIFHELNTFSPILSPTSFSLLPPTLLHLEEFIIDLEHTPDITSTMDFSLIPDTWNNSLSYYYSQLISARGTSSNLLYHNYLFGKIIHEEEIRLLGRLTPTLSRSRRIGRKLYQAITNTIKQQKRTVQNHYYAAKRIFALYSVLGPQNISAAKTIIPHKIRNITKADFIILYNHAKVIGQSVSTFPYHLSVFIGTTELQGKILL